MNERPNLDISLDSNLFKEYYYLKEELIDFCKKYKLQTKDLMKQARLAGIDYKSTACEI